MSAVGCRTAAAARPDAACSIGAKRQQELRRPRCRRTLVVGLLGIALVSLDVATSKALTLFAGLVGNIQPGRRTILPWSWHRGAAIASAEVVRPAVGEQASDGSWEPPKEGFSGMLRAIGSQGLQDRKVLPLGKRGLRLKSKVVKPDRVTNEKSVEVLEELVRVMRGPRILGREKGGTLAAPQLGTPSRLIVVEDPAGEISDLSAEQRELQGRQKPFGPKAIFNPRISPVTDQTVVLWERSATLPGYRALVERPLSVQVNGMDPEGREVDYVAHGWEARLVQQSVDMLDGLFFTDRCIMRSLRHLDAQDDPLPPDCPATGIAGTSRKIMSEEELSVAAAKGGSRGFLAGIPGLGRPNVLLAGSLMLRLNASDVPPSDVTSTQVANVIKELREAFSSGKHPLGIAAPQLGHRLRIVAIGETSDDIDKLSARDRVAEEHRPFGPIILLNPTLKRRENSPDTYFFERSPSIPGYEAVVGRSLEVDVEGLNERGEQVSLAARGWQARMLQHTIDMLDGVLYVDRMERRSFRRDTVEDELPNDVPFGVRQITKVKVQTKTTTRPRIGASTPKGVASGRAVRAKR